MIAGCSSAAGSDSSGEATAESTPLISVPKSQPALKAAVDCSKSDVELGPESLMEGVRLDASTDPTRTSLLLKNTGNLSVIVLPNESFTTRLAAAPYASPRDQASRAALLAVNSSGGLATVAGLPAYVPMSQFVIVPPRWSVCALTDNVDEIAAVRYLQDKSSSAEYFVARELADQLLPKVGAAKARPTLVSCTKTTVTLLKSRPDLMGVELYAEILGPESGCRAGYKALLRHDARATQQLSTTVLNRLELAPQLLENSRLFDALAYD